LKIPLHATFSTDGLGPPPGWGRHHEPPLRKTRPCAIGYQHGTIPAESQEQIMEAATAFWHSTAMFTPQPHGKISRGRNRQFESVENAVTFVMEKLEPGDRATAMIQTDNRPIHLPDIMAIYAWTKQNPPV
jgi:hypothetical protein